MTRKINSGQRCFYSASQAFTLVELLVMIAVGTVLITVVTLGFGSWRTSVAQAELKNDLLNVKAGMEDARNRTNAFPVFSAGTQFDGTNSTRSVFTQSQNVTVTYRSGNTTTYCIDAQSKAVSTLSMFINMSSANKAPQSGTC